MLLTITYKGNNANILSYLLHKNPFRPQTIELNYGKAHVYYPIIDDSILQVALLLDLNPIDIVRGRHKGNNSYGLFDYVNDRPYVASSFLSTAIARAFRTAMAGRCDKYPESVKEKLQLTASITMLPCFGGETIIQKLFTPLGYTVQVTDFPLDCTFPEWGQSCYFNVTISGKICLSELLTHLYVLIPVLDNAKHYWIGEEEIEKLLRNGEGWLQDHPMKEFITDRKSVV